MFRKSLLKKLQNDEMEALKQRYISMTTKIHITMEYQKITNLLDNGVWLNALNQPSKFRTKNWVE